MTSELAMIPADQKRFSQAFNRLAVAKRLHPDEIDAAMKRVYFETLSDLPIEHVEAAAVGLERDTNPFPKAGEWRERTLRERDRVEEAKYSHAPPVRWSDGPECAVCDDTGFQPHRGPRGESPWSHRAKTPELRMEIIEWVSECPCRPTNSRYQKKLAEARKRQQGTQEASAQEQRSSRGRGGFTRVGE